jgi:pimeloyl-ACP methyl ester carboxylesterase
MFRIDVPQAALDDLVERLRHVRWPDELPGAGWSRGVPLDYLKAVVSYWRDGFDWRAREAELNEFAHFKSARDGLHFIHERGKGPNPTPLLLLHGWPDSFYRMIKVIPMLTDPAQFGGDPNDAFDVIVPSLPGYGFSEAPGAEDSGIADTAPKLLRLMGDDLGYDRFGVAGGDGGSPLAQAMALTAPNAVLGIHLTDLGYHNQLETQPTDLSPAEGQYLREMEQGWMVGGGYVAVQGTRPLTLAYGLTDSPVALAAWILDKFHDWSDHGGAFANYYPMDELLTNISIYWFTGTIGSSIQGYYEEMHEPSLPPGQPIPVPVGMALFPEDSPPPREYAERLLRIDHWTEMARGGHFTAWEAPELYTEDLRDFFRPLR